MKLRRYLTLLLLLAFCISLAGCASMEEWVENHVTQEKDLYDQTVDAFFAALDARDAEGIRSLFAVAVQNHDTELDQQIQALFDLYPGPTDRIYRPNRPNRATQSKEWAFSSYMYSTFPVISNGTHYFCDLCVMDWNDKEPDKVGLISVLFYTEESFCAITDKDLEGYDTDFELLSKERNTVGVHAISEFTVDGEVRTINRHPAVFTPMDREMDVEEAVAALEKSNLYSDFEVQFGEPNAVSIDIEFSYELPEENGEPRYLLLLVLPNPDDHLPRVEKAMVANDLEVLQEVWIGERIRKERENRTNPEKTSVKPFWQRFVPSI